MLQGAEAMVMTNPYATKIRRLSVGDRVVLTDQEGYIQNMDDWDEHFAIAQAATEGLTLTDEHWEVIRYLRNFYEEHQVQAQVRAMIKHFQQVWGPARGNNRYLHDLFPNGGPQKQGNRVAGLMRTRGEH
jgi:tRNA 2-thiouridine synthesizing protein E